MRDERLTVNTETEFNADGVNLAFWQLGAMGLVAPKAVMLWTRPSDNPPGLGRGTFAWDQTTYGFFDPLPTYIISYVVNAVGDYTLTFANQVLGRPDADGVQQTEVLAFQLAIASANIRSSSSSAYTMNVTLLSPQQINIKITDVAAVPVHESYTLAVF